MLMAGFAVVMLAGVAVLAYFYYQDGVKKADQQAYEAAMQQTTVLRGKRQYDEAVSVAMKYVEIAKSNDNASYMLATVGSMQEEQNDQKSALETYRKAEKRAGRDVLGIAYGIARTSMKLGDKPTALMYYKKCLAVLRSHASRTNAMDIDYMEKTIAKLEAAS